MTEAAHSKFSASAASRWISCPGSMVLSVGKADQRSSYAADGSAMHEVADACMQSGAEPAGYLDREVMIDGTRVVITQDMVECVEQYLQHIAELTAGADIVQSETRTNYAAWLNVPTEAAWGTADCTAAWIDIKHLLVADLKTGRGVEVDAENNEQGMLYAGGKLLEMDALGIEIETIDIVISQPRVRSAPSVWKVTRAELEAWLTGRARSGAMSVLLAERETDAGAWQETFLSPSEKACRFCRAKATCPALRQAVIDVVAVGGGTRDISDDDFEVVVPDAAGEPDLLAACMAKADLIEDWLKAVRAEVERRLLAGTPVPGYKLVQGKQGNRAWSDKAGAEKLLRETFRLPIEKAYDLSLISPTSAEKLAKAGDIGPRQWPKAEAMITRSAGKPSVAPVSDKRPALEIAPIDDAFESQSPADDIC